MIHTKSNTELLKEFDKHVIGHTAAKKMLISMVNRSKTAHYHKHGLMKPNHTIETINCMLVGGSGTGKTHLVNTLKNIIHFPLIRIDSQMLAPGDNSRGMGSKTLKKLIVDEAKKTQEKYPLLYSSVEGTVDQTVVFIDEIDKIAGCISNDSKTWNKQVQAALLTMIENSGRFKQVSFILAGAFVGIDKPSNPSKPIGFFHNKPSTPTKKSISSEIINFGLIPELVGRLSGISVLDKLTTEVLENILYNILLPQSAYLFNKGLDIDTPELSKTQADMMIKDSLTSGQGVRYLKRELNTFFTEAEFDFEVKL